jgi:DNA modification methylase
MILTGDCLTHLKAMPDNSLDALVTDPPAGISFMGKEWDSDKGGRDEWIKWMSEVMRECLRVLKPGAHGLVWAIPRTNHWTGTALELAGFEVRDVITHLFGQGFPKSLNIEKAGAGIDWKGWGTALKPAVEFWYLVRKPCSEKTVAQNVLKHGTGGINIDGSRIGTERMGGQKIIASYGSNDIHFGGGEKRNKEVKATEATGRFPSNLVLSHSDHCTEVDEMDRHTHEVKHYWQCTLDCAVKMLDEQSGNLKSGALSPANNVRETTGWSGGSKANRVKSVFTANSGGASRFFYCAKISTRERGEGNNHPTVKPKKLMGYLIKLITPPGGTVLDPFMGSGSTGIAAKEHGFKFIGIEQNPEYVEIATKRIESIDVA